MGKCVLAFVFVFCMLTSVSGIQAATLLVDPATQDSPSVGEILSVDFRIEGVTELSGYGFDLVFDTSALRYVDMEEGEFLKGDGTTTMFMSNIEGTSDGILKIADLRYGSPPPAGVDGSGILVSMTFEVLAVKASVLTLQNVKLHKPDLGLIDVDVVNGSVTTPVALFSIAVTSGDHGSISPTGETIVLEGVDQTFSVIPNLCYHVTDLLVDGVSVGSPDTYTFSSITSDHTIHATFAMDTYSITATAGANGSITPSGTSTVDCGASQTYDITPTNGYHIVDVLVDGNSVGSSPTYTFSGINADHTIAAIFAESTYAITVMAGNHGNISPTGETVVTAGGSQAFTIVPDSCYRVSDVLVDGVSIGSTDTHTFTNVTADHTIHATFAIDTHTITATAGANGSITPSATSTVNCGSSQEYTIAPADGYQVADVLVDGKSIGVPDKYTFEALASDHEIVATFIPSEGRPVEPMGKQFGEWGYVKRTVLLQNYPNPFNPDTWIPYQLSKASDVSITIYDATGRIIRELDLGHKLAGTYRTQSTAVHWDGRNETGEHTASGVYFVLLKAGEYQQMRRMVLLK